MSKPTCHAVKQLYRFAQNCMVPDSSAMETTSSQGIDIRDSSLSTQHTQPSPDVFPRYCNNFLASAIRKSSFSPSSLPHSLGLPPLLPPIPLPSISIPPSNDPPLKNPHLPTHLHLPPISISISSHPSPPPSPTSNLPPPKPPAQSPIEILSHKLKAIHSDHSSLHHSRRSSKTTQQCHLKTSRRRG